MAIRRLDELIDYWDPTLRRAFLSSVYSIRSQAQVEHLVRLIAARDIEAAIRAIGIDAIRFEPYGDTLFAAFRAAGNRAALMIPRYHDTAGILVNFNFDTRKTDVNDKIEAHILQIVNGQLLMVREHILAQLDAGRSPRAIALDLIGRLTGGQREGGLIGLAAPQAEWVRNYRKELTDKDPAAMERKFHDRRLNTMIKEERMTADDVDSAVAGYTNKLLAARASGLGISMSSAMAHDAQGQAIALAIAGGFAAAIDIKQKWNSMRDSKTRPSHFAMHGQTAAPGTPFVTPDGVPLRHPHDPRAPLSETAGCRCWISLEV